MVTAIRKLTAPLQRRVRLMVSRGIVRLVNDAATMQELQLGLLADETRDSVERAQNYGFSSRPHAGAEAIVVCVGGSRDHSVCIAVDDRRYRVRGLQEGEVAIYTDEGDSIVLKRGREIHITSGALVHVAAPTVSIVGNVEVEGNIHATGTITGEA